MTGKTSSMLDEVAEGRPRTNEQMAKSYESKILAYIGKHPGCSMQDLYTKLNLADIPMYKAIDNLMKAEKIEGESPYGTHHMKHSDYTYTLKGKKGYTLISSKIRDLALIASLENPETKISFWPYIRDPQTKKRLDIGRYMVTPDTFRKEPSETPREEKFSEPGEEVESYENGKWIKRVLIPKVKVEPKKHPVKVPQKTPGLQPSEEEVKEKIKKAGYREKAAVIRNIANRAFKALEDCSTIAVNVGNLYHHKVLTAHLDQIATEFEQAGRSDIALADRISDRLETGVTAEKGTNATPQSEKDVKNLLHEKVMDLGMDIYDWVNIYKTSNGKFVVGQDAGGNPMHDMWWSIKEEEFHQLFYLEYNIKIEPPMLFNSLVEVKKYVLKAVSEGKFLKKVGLSESDRKKLEEGIGGIRETDLNKAIEGALKVLETGTPSAALSYFNMKAPQKTVDNPLYKHLYKDALLHQLDKAHVRKFIEGFDVSRRRS